MKSISLKITDGLDQQLAEASYTQQITKSDLVREAIQAYLADHAMNRSSSCFALAGDLIGSVEGPEDSSFNKIYLSGFGA